jgi:hypothetical protein
MRTTVTLDEESAAAVNQLREQQSIGLSEAVNRLIHGGLPAGSKNSKKQPPRQLPTQKMGLMIDVTNVAEALERLEGPNWR